MLETLVMPSWMTAAASTLTADLSESRRLIDAGTKLVRLNAFTKQPQGLAWNHPSNYATTIDDTATGYGLPLAANGLVSIDPDNVRLAALGMAAIGLDLEKIMQAGARTRSTRTGSGGRSIFRAPQQVVEWLKFSGKTVGTILELRATSPNLQDVVAGLVYRTKDGQLCTQQYANNLRPDTAPEMQPELLNFWHKCSVDLDYFHAMQKAFMAACGEVPNLAISGRDANGKVTLALRSQRHSQDYNAANTVESILERHGYKLHHGGRWECPTATGQPGIRPIPGKEGLWRSDHASDPLSGTFDAWLAHVVLDHGGDLTAAERAHDTQQIEGMFNAVPVPVAGAEHVHTSQAQTGFVDVSICDVLSHPEEPHRFIVGQIVPAGALTLLSGHGGSGKSYLGLEMAVHVAMGKPYLGMQTTQCNVMVLSAEDGGGVLRRRVAQLCQRHGIDPVELSQTLSVLDATADPVLWAAINRNDSGVTAAHHELTQRCTAAQIGLLVVDNASDTFGGDSSDKSAVTRFVRSLTRCVHAQDGAVLLLAHVNRTTAAGSVTATGSWSDSVAWHNAARSRLFFDTSRDQLALVHEKSNYGPIVQALSVSRHPFGGFETQTTSSATEGLPAQVLGFIHAITEEGGWIGAAMTGTTSNNICRKSYRDHPEYPDALRGGTRNGEAFKTVQSLKNDGFITLEKRWPSGCDSAFKRNNQMPNGFWLTDQGRNFLEMNGLMAGVNRLDHGKTSTSKNMQSFPAWFSHVNGPPS